MDLKLTGKRVLVCAASRGIGFAVASEMAREGARLWMVSRSQANISAAAKKLSDVAETHIETAACDLTDAFARSQMVEAIGEKWGGIDILISNVGGPPPSAAAATSADAWRSGFEQLFMSTESVVASFLPGMRQQQFGRIITVTSISVVEPIEHLAVSTAMRAAVTGYAKTLATEVASDNITVNTVMPGVIHTERIEELRLARANRNNTSLAAEMEKTRQAIPAQRLGRPDEIAALITFLASERASYITGQNIAVDGGLRRSY